MEGYDASTYGDRFADVYDDWYSDVTDISACTERLAALAAEAGGGPVLELGIGSGRLALPLAERGIEVHGIDASNAMLDLLRAKPGGADLHVTHGDMAALDLVDPPVFAVVFVAFNTFFNLGSIDEQQRCLDRVAALLAPRGQFVVEAFVPSEDGPATEGAITPRRIVADEVVLSISQHDRTAQTVTANTCISRSMARACAPGTSATRRLPSSTRWPRPPACRRDGGTRAGPRSRSGPTRASTSRATARVTSALCNQA